MHLLSLLAEYALALFSPEAKKYPRDPRLRRSLQSLADRARRRVMDTVGALENGEPMNSLRYHDVKVSVMSATIDDALREALDNPLAACQRPL
jgi:hypothetical protein